MNATDSYTLETATPVHAPDSAAADALRQRIGLLDRDDQVILELALNAAMTHRRIADILGIEPGNVSRRIRRLGRRLHDPLVARLLDPRCPLGPDYRQIGVEHFLAGRTIAQIAARLGRSRASVRMTLEHVRAWHGLPRAILRRID